MPKRGKTITLNTAQKAKKPTFRSSSQSSTLKLAAETDYKEHEYEESCSKSEDELAFH